MPIQQFQQWLSEAKAHPAISEPTAMTLATVGAKGKPSARIVLLKEVDARGFVFYTNLESRKSREIHAQPHAALCFYWMPLDKQVRVEGTIHAVSAAESDAYFATRVREKQIGAWASKQSEIMESRDALEQRIAEITARFEGQNITRPPHWGGWRLVPERIEFWQQRDFRLHVRDVYLRAGEQWQHTLLYP
jgi:pyridoxamine 5'-phosphate oxidase